VHHFKAEAHDSLHESPQGRLIWQLGAQGCGVRARDNGAVFEPGAYRAARLAGCRTSPVVHMSYMLRLPYGWSRATPTVLSSSVEDLVFAGDVNAGDVVVLPGASNAVLVKTIRLGKGGFIFTVAPVGDDRPQAEQLVTLSAGARLRKGDLAS
jgi:hypothetical protein